MKKRKAKKRERLRTANEQPTGANSQSSSQSPFTSRYLRALWNEHPLQPAALLKWAGAIAFLGFLAALAAIKGVFSQFILQIASENMAPRTAIFLGALSLCVVSGVIAVRGPFASRSGWVYRTFGVAVPKFALGTWGMLCGISFGTFAAALILGAPVRPYASELGLRLVLFFWGVCFFTAITVIPSDAPAYGTQRFKKTSRRLAAVMFLLMVGWFIVAGMYMQSLR